MSSGHGPEPFRIGLNLKHFEQASRMAILTRVVSAQEGAHQFLSDR